MSAGTFDYRDVGRAGGHRTGHRLRRPDAGLGRHRPAREGIDRPQGHAPDAGRDLPRPTLERAVRAGANQAEGKKGRTATARAAAGGVARDAASGTG